MPLSVAPPLKFGHLVLTFKCNSYNPKASPSSSSSSKRDSLFPLKLNVSTKGGFLIWIHYTARFADGTVFDSSYKRARLLTMPIGVEKVIKGLDQGSFGGGGVSPMVVGGKRKLRIPPELAYGPDQQDAFKVIATSLLYDINFVGLYK